jgi:hypothetical protein
MHAAQKTLAVSAEICQRALTQRNDGIIPVIIIKLPN